MSGYIKRCRENAGLTQTMLAEKMDVSPGAVQNWESGKTKIEYGRFKKLSEVLNVPMDDLIREMIIEMDEDSPDNWPDFFFDEDTNNIINTLHLNHAQQELFGLLYIYDADYLKKDEIDFNTLNDDLKKIPYGFIEKVGSIHFMNQVEGLHRVIKYVKADFLLDVLSLNPDAEFNVRKLTKEQICRFIDSGYKPIDDTADSFEDNDRFEAKPEEGLYFRINMHKARILLPVLAEHKSVHLTDGAWSEPIRDDIPDDVRDAILKMCDFDYDLWKDGYYKDKYQPIYVIGGLERVTEYKNTAEPGQTKYWEWSISDLGSKLLEWFDD